MPVVAFHGTSKPELIGQAVSNGCIRVPNDAIAKIAATVPVGTPVDIVA
jgi:lipoprotein-anchoring transpeptidase ErfK/SrfK